MKPETIKELLKWAKPCINDKEVLSEIDNGIINEESLSKCIPKAYNKVREKEEGITPVKEYMFREHNKFIINYLSKINADEAKDCLALAGRVISNYDNKVLVNILGKEKECSNSCGARKGEYVGIHRGEAVEILSREEYKKYNELIIPLKELL